MLADRSGRSKRFSEDFLREFFALISETLEAQDSVKIKGLGTFRLTRVEPRRSVDVTTGEPMEISGHSKVVFIPSKELAEAVNAPFEAFSAIEIADHVDLSKIFTPEEISLQEDENLLTSAPLPLKTEVPSQSPTENALKEEEIGPQEESLEAKEDADSDYERNSPEEESVEETASLEAGDSIEVEAPAEKENSSEEEETIEEENSSEEEEIIEEEGQTEVESEEEKSEESTEESESEVSQELEDYEEEEETRKRGWWKILLISLCAIIVALFATLAVWYYFATDDFNSFFNKYGLTASSNRGGDKNADQLASSETSHAVVPGAALDSVGDSVKENETIDDVPTAPSDAVVYDTISTTRYLTTMAKAHYGNFNLWPYIYQENQSFLGHPDRIRPGTPVVIPKLSKYGVDPKNSADIEKAKKLGVEIYARYGKKI